MLVRPQLDAAAARGCDVPGCDHAAHDATRHLHARCHPEAGLWASYAHGSGVLVLTCRNCAKTVAAVAVADRQPAPEGGPR